MGNLIDLILTIFTVRNSSCGKVMFLQVSVCEEGRGVDPPGQTPLLGRHPLPETPPRTGTPWANIPTPPETATAADSTHPTGMHSCKFSFQNKNSV